MAKSLIVCCDGTWNTPDQQGAPSNVTKMARAIMPRDSNGDSQIVYYDEGVGTGNVLDRFVGGTLGVGLDENVEQAYRFLTLNYEPGDRILMFGFSRGAFTVRSLAGFVNLVGLLRKGDLDKMKAAWRHYRTKPAERRIDAIDPRWVADRDPGVALLGVWDTVGALGIPGNLFGRLGRRSHEFHDVTLSRKTRRAYQALAIDEHRKTFQPAIWDTTQQGADQIVEQVWFAGAHSNVGGGYPDPVLSDQAFLWMVDKARPLLAFDEDYLQRRVNVLKEDTARGRIVDSSAGWWKVLGRTDRFIGKDPSETIHPSAFARRNACAPQDGSDAGFDPCPYISRSLEDWCRRTVAPQAKI